MILSKTFTQDYSLSALTVGQGTTSIANLGYGYSNNDFSITNISDNNVTARTESYVYTPSTRLQNTYGTWGQLTYYQDAVGNRTYDIFNDGTTTTTKNLLYPSSSNLVGSVTQASSTVRTLTHDGAGNVITDARGSTTYNYRYNNRGRLDQLTIGSTVTTNYGYDGLERMAVRTTQNMTPSGTTHYLYDRAGRLLVEATGTGTTQREYVWIDDTPLALFADLDTSSPQQWYVHPDHLDRPTKMTDASQTVVWDAYYWPYGEVRSISGTANNNLRFPGQYFLVESGLHYNWHRHYDPTLGRYIQADPNRDVAVNQPVNLDGSPLVARDGMISGSSLSPLFASSGNYNTQIGGELPEFSDGANLYQYARSSPQMYVDFWGLQTSAVCVLGGPLNPACGAGVVIDIAKICVGIGLVAGTYEMSRSRSGSCSCSHRDTNTSNGDQSCQMLRETGVCPPRYTGKGTDRASCQSNARANATEACRGCLGHCLFRSDR